MLISKLLASAQNCSDVSLTRSGLDIDVSVEILGFGVGVNFSLKYKYHKCI